MRPAMRILARTTPSRQSLHPPYPLRHLLRPATYSTTRDDLHDARKGDQRLQTYGRVLEDEFAAIRDSYQTPKLPIVLAHGLFGFDTLKPLPALPLHYWRGIAEALQANGIEVITAAVPPSASIQVRAARLREVIAAKARGQRVNVVAHSMGGLDARLMLAQMARDASSRAEFAVQSLTTIASPHRGSHVADELLRRLGPLWLPRIYSVLERLGLSTDAFAQLTRAYLEREFNPAVRDVPGVRYYSYGAAFEPQLTSVFRQSHRLLAATEGENDGLVSVESSRWGEYKGTLKGVSHLDLINWTNRLRWWVWGLGGHKRKFNAIAFYLDIADMLAKEGF